MLDSFGKTKAEQKARKWWDRRGRVRFKTGQSGGALVREWAIVQSPEGDEGANYIYVCTHTHTYTWLYIYVNNYREACSRKSIIFEGSEGGASLAWSRSSKEAYSWDSEQVGKEEMWEKMTGVPGSGAPEPSQLGSLGTGEQPEWTSIWPGFPRPLCGKQTLE